MTSVRVLSVFVIIRLFFGTVTCAHAQNLVPNPSFEDAEYCPSGSTYKAEHWFAPTDGSPDIYRDTGVTGTCYENCDWIGVFNTYTSWSGFQLPRTGDVYAGLGVMLAVGSDQREYLSVQLTGPLIGGKKYCVSFYTSLANSSGYASDAIGLCLTEAPFNDCSGYVLLASTGEVKNQSGNILNDTLNWILVSDTFTAAGGELYLTLGCFHPDSTVIIQSTGQGAPYCYHYIDDVSVVFCDTFAPVYPSFNFFPNPSNGEFNISGNFPSETRLIIYNMLGQKIGESISLPEGNNIISVDLDLAQGVYYYELCDPAEQLAEGKFIIVE